MILRLFSHPITKKTLLLFWRLHHTLLTSLIILLALVLIIFRSTSYYLEANPHIIRGFLDSYFVHKGVFDEIDVHVSPFFPSVSMKNLAITNASGKRNILSFSFASIELNIPLSIVNGQIIINQVLLDDGNLLVQRSKDGKISLADIKPSSTKNNFNAIDDNPQFLRAFLSVKNVSIRNSQILFVDQLEEYTPVNLTDINLSLKTKGFLKDNGRHQLILQAALNETETKLDLRLDLKGRVDDLKTLQGKIYASLDKLTHNSILNFIKYDLNNNLNKNVSRKDRLQIENFQLDQLQSNVKMWSEIKKGELQSVLGELSIKDTVLERLDDKKTLQIDHFKTNFNFDFSGHNLSQELTPIQEKLDWFIDLYDLDFNINAQAFTHKRLGLYQLTDELSEFSKFRLFLHSIDIDNFSSIAAFFLPDELSRKTYHALHPEGQLDNTLASFTLNVSAMPFEVITYQIQSDLSNFSINDFKSIPKITNLSAQLRINEKSGRLNINSHDMGLYLKSLFRDPWPVNRLSGEIYWQKEGMDWLLGGENIVFNNVHLSANADLKLWFLENGQKFLDLSGFYYDADVKFVPYYLPAAVMSDGLVKWLDEAFLSGRGSDGGVVFRGNLSHFPFKDKSGAMDISFNTKDVLLNYHSGWPLLRDINAIVQFTEQGMSVDAQQSKVFSAVSNNIHADIEHYLIPELRIKGDIKTTIDDAVLYLQESKLVSDEVINIIDAKDEINLNLDLMVHMKGGKPDSKVTISFTDADYYPPGFERKKGLVSHLKGDVIVHNNLINSKNLSADLMGSAAKVVIKTEKNTSSKKSSRINTEPNIAVVIDSRTSIKQLNQFKLLPTWLSPLKKHLTGRTKVHLDIKIPNKQQTLAFNISSNLSGLSSTLPAPFTKSKQAISPFKLHFRDLSESKKSSKKSRLKMTISDKLSLALLLDTSQKEFDLLKGNIVLESGQAKLPKQNVLRISGSSTRAPLDQWAALFASDTAVKTKKNEKNPFLPIQLAMTELILPELKDELKEESKPDRKQKKKAAIKNDNTLDPGQFPLLNGYINSIKLGTVELGKLQIQSTRVDNGISFDQIQLQGSLFSFDGHAKWHQLLLQPETHLQAELKVPSIEKFSEKMNLKQIMTDGEAVVSGAVNWKGDPANISNENLAGNISLTVKNGTFIDAEPGAAGRLLGLINLNALARRITLDFTDVSNKGFEFDKISGDFRFLNANAYTDNLKILSPSADILITGRTGMIDEDFDQQVKVIPEISAALPIAGAAIGGPAGAAIGWAGQKILGKHLNKITAFNYTVSGSWEDPEIKKGSVEAVSDADNKQDKLNNNNPLFETRN